MVYFKIGSTFLGWWIGVACKSFKACLLQDFITPLGYGANKGHSMKRKSGKRKSGKRSFKPLEISFSWFKVVFLMER